MAWQKIETAPTDGTPILVVHKQWWTPINGNNRWVYSKIKETSWNGHQFEMDGMQPTHWMPRPEMPTD